MPIYEYARPDGSTFEIVQAFDDEALSTDPDSGVPVRRVLHAPAVHFKGKGFYNTDYGTRKRAREQAAQEKGAKSSEPAVSKDKGPASGDGNSGGSSTSTGSGAAAAPVAPKQGDSKKSTGASNGASPKRDALGSK